MLPLLFFFVASFYVNTSTQSTGGVEKAPYTMDYNYRDTAYEMAGIPTPPPSDILKEQPTSPSSQKIIKTGHLAMEVDSIDRTYDEIQKVVINVDGYISKALFNYHYDTSQDSQYGTLSIRVPVERFAEATALIKMLANKVTVDTMVGEDVTEEYTDLNAQIKNLEATEAELRELFNRTGDVAEILQVQRELANVRGQIEVKKGRMQYLEERAALSTIEITMVEHTDKPIVNEEWNVSEIVRLAATELVDSLQKLIAMVVYGVIVFGPYALVLGGVLLLVRKLMKK